MHRIVTQTEYRPRRRRPERSELEDYIPPYLRRLVHPYHGDFCFCHIFHPRLMAQLMCEGFLPIASGDVLLPKLHAHRCVISLEKGDLHISKSTRKKSKKFTFTVNQAFAQVVEGCRRQHQEKCWLYPTLVEVFAMMHRAEHTPAVLMDNKTQPCPVRMYSIEVWNVETGALAGGELGYTVGSIYTSLTGFAVEDSAGSVQLATLGRLLTQLGFSLWDLGMEMDYKMSLGCHLMARDEFLAHVHAVRYTKGHLILPKGSYQCRNVIDNKCDNITNSPMSVSSQPGQQAASHTSSSMPSLQCESDPQRNKRIKSEDCGEERKVDEHSPLTKDQNVG